MASVGLSALWRPPPGGVARGGPDTGGWPACAGHHGTVHGRLSPVAAHHPATPARPLWGDEAPGDGQAGGGGPRGRRGGPRRRGSE